MARHTCHALRLHFPPVFYSHFLWCSIARSRALQLEQAKRQSGEEKYTIKEGSSRRFTASCISWAGGAYVARRRVNGILGIVVIRNFLTTDVHCSYALESVFEVRALCTNTRSVIGIPCISRSFPYGISNIDLRLSQNNFMPTYRQSSLAQEVAFFLEYLATTVSTMRFQVYLIRERGDVEGRSTSNVRI